MDVNQEKVLKVLENHKDWITTPQIAYQAGIKAPASAFYALLGLWKDDKVEMIDSKREDGKTTVRLWRLKRL